MILTTSSLSMSLGSRSEDGFTLPKQTINGVEKHRLNLTVGERAVSIAAREIRPGESKGLFFFITLLFWKKIKVTCQGQEREILVNRSSIKKHLVEDATTPGMQRVSLLKAFDNLGLITDVQSGPALLNKYQEAILREIGGDWGLTFRAENSTHTLTDGLSLEVGNGRIYLSKEGKKVELDWFLSSDIKYVKSRS